MSAFAWRVRCAVVGLLRRLCSASRRSRCTRRIARIRAQRDTLERIRREREELERRAAELQTSVHDLDEEVTNLDRRADATARLVKALDDAARDDHDRARRRRRNKVNAVGERARREDESRCTSGSSTSTSAARCSRRRRMLSARSFGELVARYKYLHLLAVRDRSLVTRVEQLHDQVQRERDNLVALQTSLEDNRQDKAREEDAAARRSSASARRASPKTRQQAKQTEDRLERLTATEAQLTNAIASLEADRRRAESARPAATRAEQLDQDERLRQARLAGRRPAALHLRQGADGEQHDHPLGRRRHQGGGRRRRCTRSRRAES